MITYQITDIEKFIDADVSDLRNYNGAFNGTVSIETPNGWMDISGEHGESDYEQEYGFKIVQL